MASQQEKLVGQLLKKIASDTKSQVDFSTICSSLLHKGIVVDYWIPSLNCVIEVHGVQHYKPSSFGKDKVQTLVDFNKQMNRDSKLVKLCDQYKLNYVEIPYTENVTHLDIYCKLMDFMDE